MPKGRKTSEKGEYFSHNNNLIKPKGRHTPVGKCPPVYCIIKYL